ncbi:phosphoribosylglycinamide synthetase ATP-grasp (A) domain protein [Legionella birminghamensis]|uniref:Phosphoribosylglycinamide synthetase ATP-grasp (A) domain protein n=1 Tax=Legionella birminghamensis TaxID=28083 RepID=A0A378ILZ6_9GAMM|nr:ATP-grasp domain-containing protein [Legionella birminghamensis]KTC75366.1 phosphoribosylglycinamide synthetase ATP-grasp (A) domain protein [Legionella birminghamensis]STX33134.1 phosphoribosylglycinamide synthetase ATP-grasp (A) domain protein [Legionella birminghamensis]
MNRPVVIVDPLSSGIDLAPAFRSRGIPSVAVTFKSLEEIGFGLEVQTSDFISIIPDQPNLVGILRDYNPLAIIPGDERGVALAEQLTQALTPHLSNDPRRSLHRIHKAYMQTALEEAGVPHLKTINTASEKEVELWIRENGLQHSPLIVKPPLSAGSDKVFHINVNQDWKEAFKKVLQEPSKTTGKKSETVVVQEQAMGTEFAVGTVSANGKHYLAHLIQYNKTSFHGRKTVFDYVEFLPYCDQRHKELFAYTQQVLDALGVRWGAAHTEIMLTANGPRLIESGARICGGPTVRFAREATGSSQADKLVEAYVNGDVLTKEYQFKKSVIPVFLKSPAEGIISNVEAIAGVSELPTLLDKYIWFKNGDRVPHTVDYLSSIGIVALSGERDLIFSDYKKIRSMEAKLVVLS